MIPHQFEIVTATTVILVGVILTVYLSLLKKNGWIGNNFGSTTAIPISTKPLQKPVNGKTYLTTKEMEVARSKPEHSAFIPSNKRPLGEVMLQSKTAFKAKYSAPKISENKILTANTYDKEQRIEKTVIPAIKTEEKVNLQKINHGQIVKQENFAVKKEGPEGCNNFLGYLRGHSKNKPLPDECFVCSKLIGCAIEVAIKPKEKENSQIMNNESFIKQKSSDIKKEKPQGCSNFLGYLNVHPKGVPLPDECFACSSLIDCTVKQAKQ